MDILKDDINFLEKTLEKAESRSMYYQLESINMLRDQISTMRKRHLTTFEPDTESLCPNCNLPFSQHNLACSKSDSETLQRR